MCSCGEFLFFVSRRGLFPSRRRDRWFHLDFYRLDFDQRRVNFPVADAFELANRFFAASIALSEVRADRTTIERWQQRKSF